MELRQVEYFLAVVEHESVGAAAAALGVSQPTVSQSLRRLERELGVQLFQRLGRGMMLSAAGRAMVGPARRILRDTAAAEDLLAPRSGPLTGRLDILAFPAIASGPIVEVIGGFRREHPRVAIGFGALRDEDDAAGMLREGHCEFIAAHLPPGSCNAGGVGPVDGGAQTADGEDGPIEVLPLGLQEYWLAYPPGTVLPEGPVPLTDLPEIPMIFAPRGSSVADEFAATIRRGGRRPPVAVLAAHREAWAALVLAGVGGTLLERSLVEYAADRAVVRPTDPPLARSFGLAFRPQSLSPVGEEFLEFTRNHLRRQQESDLE
ncbi:LysR family transcriptional regulator [Tomitella cavernea]|uniref:LysR substrate-binding domain-containing protein n=1 Tax=Tomitella cavernea TaxID=1387982 RepID=A0ABP9C5F1_9ACTN|nr:LysR family transcriptional regulator [Tomitella cavernea]